MTMTHPSITAESLMTLEAYARGRTDFRKKVLEHKRHRNVRIGEHITLLFEDELTVRYQIQEMLRIERIFEEEGIRHEIEAYGPLVPDGRNLKATMLIEYPDVDERRRALAALKEVERRVWLQVEGREKVWPIADEDLERSNDEKTSAVHFLRWDLDDDMAGAMKSGANVAIGVDHAACDITVAALDAKVAAALAADLY